MFTNGGRLGAFNLSKLPVVKTPKLVSEDPYFNDVSLLLPLNGANNSTVFTDVKGKTINSYGSPIISTANSKWGGSSLYLNGNGDTLGIPLSQINLKSSITPTWTIETWLYQLTQTGRKIIFGNYNLPGGQAGALFIGTNQLVTNTIINYTIPQNQWIYFAATRDINGIISVYSNGVLLASGNADPSNSSPNNFIGGSPGDNNVGSEWFNGYINDFRITMNRVRDVSQVPTKPFPIQ